MTNALAQNIEQKNTNTADILMQAVSVSSASKTQEDTTSKFSNFMNNLESRTQKAQNEFDQKAKVTNTSSVNKKALEKREPIDNSKIIDKKINKDPRKVYERPVQPKEPRKLETHATKEVSKNNVEVTKNEATSAQNQEISQVKTEKTDNLDKLSDINNSSPVESSPVFSSEESEISEEIKIEIEDKIEAVEEVIQQIVEILPAISENATNIKEELKANIEEVISNIEDTSEITKIVENISSNLDNFNLSQEQKDEILQNIKTIKELLTTQESASSADFEQISTELKNIIASLAATKNNDTKIQAVEPKIDTTKIELNTQTIENTDSQTTLEISKEENSTISNIQETIEKIKELTKEIKNAIENKDFEKLNEIVKALPKEIEDTSSEIKEIVAEVENSAVQEDALAQKLDNALKELSKSLEKAFENKTEIIEPEQNNEISNIKTIEVDFSKTEKNKTQEVIQVLDKLSSNDFEKIDTTDKKTMDEILKTLEDVQNIVSDDLIKDTKELEAEIEALIKNINENKISTEELTQAIDEISNTIKTEIEKQETISLNQENTIDLVSEFEKFNNNQNANRNDGNQDNNAYDFSKNEKIELPKEEIDFNNADLDLNEVELKGKTTQTIDLKNAEENLQKTVAMQEMLDEMMVEVNIKTIPSNSGALSVADEVAKLAIGESSSLNSTTPAHGSITYDSTGTNAIIKNAASLIKSAQAQTNTQTPSMDEVLNQVTNKITQLKDGVTQKLTMVLRPNDLGRLSIELISNQNGLTTQIMAQNENVRAYIEKNIDSLRQQLSEAGVNVNSIQIKTAGSEGSTNYEGNQNFTKEQQENLNQQNNKDNQNNQQKNDNRGAKEALASMSNYDMQFAKDFSSILNKSLNYNFN